MRYLSFICVLTAASESWIFLSFILTTLSRPLPALISVICNRHGHFQSIFPFCFFGLFAKEPARHVVQGADLHIRLVRTTVRLRSFSNTLDASVIPSYLHNHPTATIAITGLASYPMYRAPLSPLSSHGEISNVTSIRGLRK